MKLAALLLLALLAQDPPKNSPQARRAKAYIAEVKKHLTESYIERDRVRADDLVKAALKALAAAPDSKEFADFEDKDALKDALKDKDDIDEALDAAARVVGDRKFDWLKLADHATRAMLKTVNDPFSRILTREDFTKLLKILQGGQREDSIGISAQPTEKGFQVAYVQYGYVAYDEGIEMGDEILELNGKPVAGRSPEDVNEDLKLKPGQAISLKIRRPGHKEEYEFRLVQRRHKPRDVHYEMLGDGVGYIRMTIFDAGLASEVKKALKALKDRGMTSLILDLRHNPGGALPASTAVADLFLPQNLTITKVEMYYKPSLFGIQIPGLGGDQDYTTKTKSDFEEMPMRILVNHASASASELLAGALQDHGRGRLIGETTYGKGVGQSPIPLTSAGGGFLPERFLYLTVLRYYLPTGRSINHKGVVPDVEYAAKKLAPERFAELRNVRTSKALAEYVDANWRDCRRLAEYDRFETKDYPGFDDLCASLKTSATRDEVREEVRRAIRRRLTAEENLQFVCDLQTDLQLQFALVDILDARK